MNYEASSSETHGGNGCQRTRCQDEVHFQSWGKEWFRNSPGGILGPTLSQQGVYIAQESVPRLSKWKALHSFGRTGQDTGVSTVCCDPTSHTHGHLPAHSHLEADVGIGLWVHLVWGCTEHMTTAFLVKNRESGQCMGFSAAAWKRMQEKEKRRCLND